MTESRRAIFLSYASQDAEAARHIVETLRSAGIEVWFDQSELRGGDAWDRQIARQIHECALNFVPAQVDYAYLLATFRRSADAIAMLHKALALDPLSAPAWRALALLLVHTGQLTDARVAAHRLAEVNPGGNNGFFGADADLFDGRTQEALEGYRREPGPYGSVGEAMSEHTLGHAPESQRALDKLIKTEAESMGYQIADVYAWRGENDKAFEWLERAYQRHDGGLGYVTYDRYLVNLHSDPRYTALLRKLKLSE
jgi:tetratricopeptide (TPR) repeat protein